MGFADYYARAIAWPGPEELAQAVIAGLGLIAAAAVLLSFGYLRAVARTLGILGVLTLMAVLLVLHDQTSTDRVSPEIQVTHARYPQDVRFLLRVGLVALPACSAVVMGAVLVETWRRRRATVPAQLNLAVHLFHQRDYDNALATIDRAIRIAPDNGDAYFHRGRIREARGELDPALADFDQAVDHASGNPLAFLHRGRLRTEKGQLDEALYDFEQALGLRPNDAETLLARGVCLARRGMISSAVNDFQRVLKLTNHTDCTIPATEYLRLYSPLLEIQTPGAQANGAPTNPALPAPEEPANDWVI